MIQSTDEATLARLRYLRQNPTEFANFTPQQFQAYQAAHAQAMFDDLVYYAENTAQVFCKPHHDPMPAAHHRVILYWLNEMAKWDGTGKQGIKRLMLFLPPGTAKSTYSARIFVSWMMMRNKRMEVMLTSASADLVLEHSTEVQELIATYGKFFGGVTPLWNRGGLAPSKEKWRATNGSRMIAKASGQRIQGFRGDLIICDDPVAGMNEAYSEIERDKLYTWFDSNLLTRMSDALSRMVIIQTRWAPDDLSGRILRLKGAKDWTIVSLPAIWEHDEQEPGFPYGLGRNRGELIWPSQQNDAYYEEQRAGAEVKFQAMFQCNPLHLDAQVFKEHLLRTTESLGPARARVRAWDFAATTKRGSDYTASCLMRLEASGRFVIEEVTRFKGDHHEVRQAVLATAEKDGKRVHISVPQDPGSAGKSQAMDYVSALAGWDVKAYVATGANSSKVDRAKPLAAQVGGGNVALLADKQGDKGWNQDFREELKLFPQGNVHDDQVDAATAAFNALLMVAPPSLEPSWGYGGQFQR